jgi:Asp-tRNA(Asn)/Glu-tRNA(Gln) amidotransferase C subunit
LGLDGAYLPFNHFRPKLPLNQLFLYSMEVTPQLIDQLAHLSRLYFSDEEKVSVQQTITRAEAFCNATGADDRYFRVPTVIKK